MKKFKGMVCLLSVVALAANAAPIYSTDWNADEDNWEVLDSTYAGDPANLGTPFASAWGYAAGSGNPAGSYAGITDTVGGDFDSDEYVSTANGNYLGDYRTSAMGVQRIDFDFYSDPGGSATAPADLRLFFVHDLGGASQSTWFYGGAGELLDDVSTGWNSFQVSLYDSGWYTPDGLTSFLTAISDVDRIGVYLAYQPNLDGQNYAIDNFSLDDQIVIPEPGTFMFLGFAFVSLSVTFRRKLSEVAAKLRS